MSGLQPSASSAARISAVLVLLLSGVSSVVLVSTFHGLRVQSWIRAYTTGEGLWSKAQKDAVIALVQYADTGNPEYFRRYEEEIRVPLGDRVAREELERDRPVLERAYQGFIQGRNHPDDVAGLATLFRQFRNVSYFDQAVDIWTEGDAAIMELKALADELHATVESGSNDSRRIREIIEALLGVNVRLSELEEAFSQTLGAGARWVHGVLTAVIVGGGFLLLLIVSIGCWLLLKRVQSTEQRLIESERSFRSIIENATYGILRADREGAFSAANPALARMLGYASVDELMRLRLSDLHARPEDYRGLVEEYDDGSAKTGIVTDWRKKDGTTIAVRLSGRQLRGNGTPAGIEMIVENITERRLLEEQRRQAQKMEAVGRLTGGLAHDLNNLLTTIVTNADLIETASGQRLSRRLDAKVADIRGAAQRAAQIIRKLLAFSRQETLALRPIDLGSAIRQTLRVIEHQLPEGIRLDATIADGIIAAADPGAVDQMLVNLATNAKDAMPNGGQLTVSLARVDLTDEDCHSHGCRAGAYACVTVRDTGMGIAPEDQDRIFEPFFTTKPRELGTGLGMPMIYGLVKQHGGFVKLDSRPAYGTLVRLYLPVSDSSPTERDSTERDDTARSASASETVLVVEDNEGVRRAATRALRMLGYRTMTAVDGIDALGLLEQHPDVDVAIVDVVMPRMSGRELRDHLRQRGYALPIVFTSGYTGEERSIAGLGADVSFLAKPWSTHELAAAIRAALDGVAQRPKRDFG